MLMRQVEISSGSQVMIGAPAEPMPTKISAAIAERVATIDGIDEAHLPQCFVASTMEQPAQVLVLSLASRADIEAVMQQVGEQLYGILPAGGQLDIWPLQPPHPLLDEVRNAGCRIHPPGGTASAAGTGGGKPWWKFW